jgi:hypothetical protein
MFYTKFWKWREIILDTMVAQGCSATIWDSEMVFRVGREPLSTTIWVIQMTFWAENLSLLPFG